ERDAGSAGAGAGDRRRARGRRRSETDLSETDLSAEVDWERALPAKRLPRFTSRSCEGNLNWKHSGTGGGNGASRSLAAEGRPFPGVDGGRTRFRSPYGQGRRGRESRGPHLLR